MKSDEVWLELGERQHGLVARRQALEAGVSVSACRHRLAQGRLIPVYAGVYRLSGHPVTFAQQVLAACLAAGPGAVASHQAAGWLHDLDGVAPVAEITVPATCNPRIHGVIVHRVRRLRPGDVEERDGITRTRVAATIIALAGVLDEEALARVVDDALVRRLISCDYLARRLDEAGRQGRKGASALRRVLAARQDGRPRAQSAFEREVLRLLDEAGEPRPVTQYRVVLPDGSVAVLDAAYPELRIAIEADSYRFHASAAAWAHDRTRNAQLTAMGWLVLPITWADLTERPEQVVALIRQARRTRLIGA